MELICSAFKLKPIDSVPHRFAAMASSIKILIKQVGEEAESFSVNPADTVQQLKQQLQLGSVSLRLKGKTLRNSVTLQEASVQEGNTLAVFKTNKPPKEFESWNQYQAARNMKVGATRKSTAHSSLHQQTQSVVMQESAHLAQKIDNSNKELGEKIDSLTKAVTIGMRKIEGSQEQ